MPRQKTSTEFRVADGAGGMRAVEDLRFELGDWPVHLRVPARRAVTWMAQLDAECEARGYPSAGLSQLDAAENTGTTTVRFGQGPNVPAIDRVRERARDRHLLVRARPSGDPSPSVADVRFGRFPRGVGPRISRRSSISSRFTSPLSLSGWVSALRSPP